MLGLNLEVLVMALDNMVMIRLMILEVTLMGDPSLG